MSKYIISVILLFSKMPLYMKLFIVAVVIGLVSNPVGWALLAIAFSAGIVLLFVVTGPRLCILCVEWISNNWKLYQGDRDEDHR